MLRLPKERLLNRQDIKALKKAQREKYERWLKYCNKKIKQKVDYLRFPVSTGDIEGDVLRGVLVLALSDFLPSASFSSMRRALWRTGRGSSLFHCRISPSFSCFAYIAFLALAYCERFSFILRRSSSGYYSSLSSHKLAGLYGSLPRSRVPPGHNTEGFSHLFAVLLLIERI